MCIRDSDWGVMSRARCGDEVYEFLDGCEQSWLQIGIRVDRGEDATPGQREICRRGVRPPQCGADAFLPRLAAGGDRPFGPAESGRLDRLPPIELRGAEDQRMTFADGRPGGGSGDAGPPPCPRPLPPRAP